MNDHEKCLSFHLSVMFFYCFKVKEIEQLLRDGAEKTCFIHIPCSPSAASEFIKRFNVWDLSDEHVSNRFIEDILKEVGSSPDLSEASVQCPMPVSLKDSISVKTRVFKTVSYIHRGTEYPVLHVDESFLLPSSTEEQISKFIKSCYTLAVLFSSFFLSRKLLSFLLLFLFLCYFYSIPLTPLCLNFYLCARVCHNARGI